MNLILAWCNCEASSVLNYTCFNSLAFLLFDFLFQSLPCLYFVLFSITIILFLQHDVGISDIPRNTLTQGNKIDSTIESETRDGLNMRTHNKT